MSYDTVERCIFCLKSFTVLRDKGKIIGTTIPALQIGDGTWLCREHDLTHEQIEELKAKVRKGITIEG